MNPMTSEWMDLSEYGLAKYEGIDHKNAKLNDEEFEFDRKMKVAS
jgi:hypothetical protein